MGFLHSTRAVRFSAGISNFTIFQLSIGLSLFLEASVSRLSRFLPLYVYGRYLAPVPSTAQAVPRMVHVVPSLWDQLVGVKTSASL